MPINPLRIPQPRAAQDGVKLPVSSGGISWKFWHMGQSCHMLSQNMDTSIGGMGLVQECYVMDPPV